MLSSNFHVYFSIGSPLQIVISRKHYLSVRRSINMKWYFQILKWSRRIKTSIPNVQTHFRNSMALKYRIREKQAKNVWLICRPELTDWILCKIQSYLKFVEFNNFIIVISTFITQQHILFYRDIHIMQCMHEIVITHKATDMALTVCIRNNGNIQCKICPWTKVPQFIQVPW